MAQYRTALPQLSSSTLFLSDSGLETDLIFNEGFELPLFASFVLLDDEAGIEALRNYYRRHAQVAQDAGVGLILETATWRASGAWATQLGYDDTSLAGINRRAVELVVEVREQLGEESGPMVISGAIGPRGDAYNPKELMTIDQAQHYHAVQIETLAATDADLVTALTVTYAAEAIGIVQAAQAAEVPVVISFTVETDGSLPDGTPLGEAVGSVDEVTGGSTAYFGINCAHPTHFLGALDTDQGWIDRVHMIRANASEKSHAELDEAEELDEGDPVELGRQYAALRARFPQINVLGGCCGTDVRHITAIARACL
jgi:S-methylmethionine-dependent homocysteine/selenocysteine methylase